MKNFIKGFKDSTYDMGYWLGNIIIIFLMLMFLFVIPLLIANFVKG